MPVRVPARVRLAASTVPLRLSLRQPIAVEVILQATRRQLLERTLQPAFAAQLLDVNPTPETEDLPKQELWYQRRFTWRVRAKQDQPAAGLAETPWQVALAGNDALAAATERCSVRLVLPQPNRLILQAQRGSTAPAVVDDQDTLRLELYPNRLTQYQLALVNASGLAKRVTVTLHALPPSDAAQTVPGRIVRAVRDAVLAPVSGELRPLPVWAACGPLPLAADGSAPTPLRLAPPGSPEAKPEAKSPAGDAKPAAPAAPPAATPAPQGLLCVIQNVEEPGERWVKWIELAVLRPARYVEPKIAYDYRGHRLVTRLRGLDFDGDGSVDLPPGEPVKVEWTNEDRQIADDAAKSLKGELKSSPDPLFLYATAPADNLRRTVNLTVDGYPRAIVYEVPCDREPPPEEVRWGSPVRSRPRVRINRLVAAGYPVEFHFPPYARFPSGGEPPKPDAPVVEHRRVPAGEQVVLPAPCEALRVDFEVDAPVDAFLRPDDRADASARADERVEVRLADRLNATLFGDRATGFRLGTLHGPRRARVLVDRLGLLHHRAAGEPGEYPRSFGMHPASAGPGGQRGPGPRAAGLGFLAAGDRADRVAAGGSPGRFAGQRGRGRSAAGAAGPRPAERAGFLGRRGDRVLPGGRQRQTGPGETPRGPGEHASGRRLVPLRLPAGHEGASAPGIPAGSAQSGIRPITPASSVLPRCG